MNIRNILRWREQDAVMIVFVAAIFVLAIVYSVYSATTIDSNVTTGGNVSSANIYASTTVQATGDALFYANLSAGASTNTPTTTFNVTGSGYFTGGLGVGFATTGTGQIHTTGLIVGGSRVGVNGTTSPYQELGVNGDAALVSGATTTLSVESTTATAGGCIELREGVPAGGIARWVRIYVGGFGATNTLASAAPAVVGAGGAGFLIIENGRCQ